MRNYKNIHDHLVQWGMWSKEDECERLGYPSMTTFRRLAGATLDWDYDIKDVPIYRTISDEQAGHLDKEISRLDLDLKTVLFLYYVERMKVGKIEKAMKIARNQARTKIETAIRVLAHSSYPQKP